MSSILQTKKGAGDRASPTSICLYFWRSTCSRCLCWLSSFGSHYSLQHGGHWVTSAFKSLMSSQPQANGAYASGGLSLTASGTWQEKIEKMQNNVNSNSNLLGEWFCCLLHKSRLWFHISCSMYNRYFFQPFILNWCKCFYSLPHFWVVSLGSPKNLFALKCHASPGSLTS